MEAHNTHSFLKQWEKRDKGYNLAELLQTLNRETFLNSLGLFRMNKRTPYKHMEEERSSPGVAGWGGLRHQQQEVADGRRRW